MIRSILRKRIQNAGFTLLLLIFFQNVIANDVVSELREKLDAFKSLSADFEQRVISQDSQLLSQQNGRFYLLRPGKFKWSYAENDQEIVSDGQKIYFLIPDLEQIIIRDFNNALSTVPSLVLVSDSSKLDQLFDIKKKQSRQSLSQYELKPKSTDSSYDSLLVSFTNNQLLGLRMIDGLGQTTEIILNDVKNNPDLPEAEFQFDIPDGYDVIGDQAS